MPSYYVSAVSCVLLLWFVKQLLNFFTRNAHTTPYPPGPVPKPLIGNAFDFPTSKAHEVYMEWGEKYKSGFVFGSAFGNQVLVINKIQDADELLERRARKYSSRPEIPAVKLIGWDWNVSLMPYGKSWRLHRQICQQNFRAEAARDYYPLLLKKTREMCRQLLHEPDNFDQHNRMLSISVPMAAMYGYDVKSLDDPSVSAADEGAILAASLLLPGATLINVIPMLSKLPVPAWLPGATAWRIAAKLRALSKIAEGVPFQFAKQGVADGTASDSFVSRFLKKKEEVGASEQEETAIRNIATTIYSAASDTTIAATLSFFYLMATHPEVQRKAQAEIDHVLGHNRLPDFDDRASLPYTDAIYRELLRFSPPAPLGISHTVIEDDYYKGYLIPKGAAVLGNVWAMTRDEEVYEKPHNFTPERFLDENGKLTDDDRILAYGFGRRVCVGKHVASATMWIIISSVLACFSIEKSKDDNGNEIEINDGYEDFGLMRQALLHSPCQES